jgi:pyruvate/2-oxoglutarate dehydrogenase complex dihydrolipoamide acyltransferase (E2) component
MDRMSAVTPLVVPQVNVNDETVLLVRWSVAQHGNVSAGDVVCEVETSKATSEVTADRGGVLVQAASAPVRVRIGEEIGAIGPTHEAATAYLEAKAVPKAAAADGTVRATGKAMARAAREGVSLEAVARSGVHGTIKESDVQRFLEAQGAGAQTADGELQIPPGLAKYVELAGPIPAFDAAVAANLRRSTEHLILASVDADCRLTAAHGIIQQALAGGRMLSLLHLIIAAASRVLPRFPRLMSFAYEGALYRYRAVDIAFVARTPDGRLYTPVVRSADRANLEGIAKVCQAEMLRVMRGAVTVEELEGACFTISHVPVGRTTRVMALPSFGQSAILGVSAERPAIDLVDGAAVERPLVTLTLSYDHSLCDGVYAAGFLAELTTDLERPSP